MNETTGAEAAVLATYPDPRILLLTLNRPRTRNSLVVETWLELDARLAGVTPDGTRCVVLTGTDGYFSSGGDLKSTPRAGTGATAVVGRLEYAHCVIRRLRALPVPVVAAVEGGAVGLGWSLALACDLLVAAEDATFAAPFVARGIVPDAGAAWFLTRRLGRTRAAALLLAGEPLSAAEAVRCGVATEVVPRGRCVARALEIARGIAGSSAHAIELTRRLLRGAEELGLDDYLALELVSAALTQTGADSAAARVAFTQQRSVP